MIELGPFTSKSGKQYIGIFYADTNIVEVLGPMLGAGAAPRVFQDNAKSEEDARKKIKEAINQGEIE